MCLSFEKVFVWIWMFEIRERCSSSISRQASIIHFGGMWLIVCLWLFLLLQAWITLALQNDNERSGVL